MPLYEYECTKCGERFEVIQKFSDDPVKLHSENDGNGCDGEVKKLLSAPAIRFKGSGWYVNDYGKGGEKPKKESGESSEKKESKSESKSSDSSSKTESKPKGKSSSDSGSKSSSSD